MLPRGDGSKNLLLETVVTMSSVVSDTTFPSEHLPWTWKGKVWTITLSRNTEVYCVGDSTEYLAQHCPQATSSLGQDEPRRHYILLLSQTPTWREDTSVHLMFQKLHLPPKINILKYTRHRTWSLAIDKLLPSQLPKRVRKNRHI